MYVSTMGRYVVSPANSRPFVGITSRLYARQQISSIRETCLRAVRIVCARGQKISLMDETHDDDDAHIVIGGKAKIRSKNNHEEGKQKHPRERGDNASVGPLL